MNEKKAGSQNGLSTPHEYDLTDLLVPGKNRISIRMDNRVIIPIGVNSHSISDHTQSNWNGITGEILLFTRPEIYIDEIKVFPDLQKETAKVIVSIRNPANTDFKGKLVIQAEGFNSINNRKHPGKNVTIVTKSGEQQIIVDYEIQDPQLWSEFSPAHCIR